MKYHLTLDSIGLTLAKSPNDGSIIFQERAAPAFVPIFGTGERTSSEGDFWSRLRIDSFHMGIPQYELADKNAYRYGFGLETRTKNRLRLANVPTIAYTSTQAGFKQILEFQNELYAITPSTNQIWRSNDGATWSMDLQASYASVIGCLFVKSPPNRSNATLPILYAGSGNSRHVYGKVQGGSWGMTYSLPAWVAAVNAMTEAHLDVAAVNTAGPPYLILGCAGSYNAFLLLDMNNLDYGAGTNDGTRVDLLGEGRITALLSGDLLETLSANTTSGASKVYVATANKNFDGGGFGILRKYSSNIIYKDLVRLSDNYVAALTTYNAQVYAGLQRKGKLWRYTGSNFAPVLELSQPDAQYSYPLSGLLEADGALWCPVKVTGQGIGLIGYQGDGWTIGPYLASSGTPQSAVAYYKGNIYFSEDVANAKIYKVDYTKWLTTSQMQTSWFYAGLRDIDKLWRELTIGFLGLVTGESFDVYYSLADAGYLSLIESFISTAKKDATNTTAVWDTALGQIHLLGLAVQNYVGKVIANLTVPHIAYQRTSVNSLTEAPGLFTSEFTQALYDAVEADDTSVATSTATLAAADDLTSGKTATGSSNSVTPANTIDDDLDTGWGMNSTSELEVWLKVDFGVPTTFNRVNLVHYNNGFNFNNMSIQGSNDDSTWTNLVTGIDIGENTQSTHSFTAVTYRYLRLYEAAVVGNRHNLKEIEVFGTAAQHYAKQLFVFDLTDKDVAGLKITSISYGTGDNSGSAANGATLKIWNWSTQAWDSVGTNTAGAADTDALKTISSTITNYTNYVDSQNKVYLLLYSTYPTRQGVIASNYVRNATINADYVALLGYYETGNKNVITLQLNQALSNNITKATLYTTQATPANTTITHYLSADGGTNWEAVTVGTEYTFTNPGTDLRWKAILATSDNNSTPTVSEITVVYTVNTWTLLGSATTVGSTSKTLTFPNPCLSKEISLRVDLKSNGTTTPALKDIELTYVIVPERKRQWDFVARCDDKLQLLDDTQATLMGADLWTLLKASHENDRVCTLTLWDNINYQVVWRDLLRRNVRVKTPGADQGTELQAIISLLEA